MQFDENSISKEDTQGQTEPGRSAGETVKTNKSHRMIAKVLCALAAVVLWFYVVGTDSTVEEKRFVGVSVEIRGLETLEKESGLSVISEQRHNVDLTLTGRRVDISNTSLNNIIIYADVSGITQAGEYSLELESSLPNGVSISSQSINSVQLYIDRRKTVSVDIEIETVYQKNPQYEIGEPVPSIEAISVSGPAGELDKIAYARVSLPLGDDVSKTVTTTGKIVLIDNNGAVIDSPYIRLQATEISVKVPVYTEKDVPLTAEYKHGYYDENNVSIKISPEVIRIKGEPEVLDKISGIAVEIDEKKILGDSIQTATVVVPEGTENVSGIRTADITVTHKGTTTRDILLPELAVINPKGLDFSLESDSIKIRFRGPQQPLKFLSEKTVKATVSLEALSGTAGTFTVPVTVTLDPTLSEDVYEIGEYTVDVTIK